MRTFLLGCLVLGVGAVGCAPSSTVDTQDSCFDACIGALAEADLEVELEASASVRNAFAAARSTFGRALQGATAVDGLASDLLDGRLALPSGFRYSGEGKYVVEGPDGAAAEVRFHLPFDTSFGKAGDPIEWDLFEPSNYFDSLEARSSVVVDLSGIRTKIEYGFSGAGPGAELLGLGASPESPLEIDTDDANDHLARIPVTVDVEVSDHEAIQRLALHSEAVRVDAATAARVALAVTALDAKNDESDQVMSLRNAELSLLDGGTNFDGFFDFSVESPRFSFDARLEYRASAEADLALGCPGSSPVIDAEL